MATTMSLQSLAAVDFVHDANLCSMRCTVLGTVLMFGITVEQGRLHIRIVVVMEAEEVDGGRGLVTQSTRNTPTHLG